MMLEVYESRAQALRGKPGQLNALLDATALAVGVQAADNRAATYLTAAIKACGDNDTGLELLEERLASLTDDGTSEESESGEKPSDAPPSAGADLYPVYCEVLMDRARNHASDETQAAALLTRAARTLETRMGQPDKAYEVLKQATELDASDDEGLDRLVALSERAEKADDLSQHLQKVANDAIDSASASKALQRLALLQADALDLPDQAAQTYKQLLILRPQNAEYSAKLRTCLREAGEFQELLAAIDQHLLLTEEREDRIDLLREAARCWQDDLDNRYEARDAWMKVLHLVPGDEEATKAVRANASRNSLADVEALLDSSLVVLPEDLTTGSQRAEAMKPIGSGDTGANAKADLTPGSDQGTDALLPEDSHETSLAPVQSGTDAPEDQAADLDEDAPEPLQEAKADTDSENTSAADDGDPGARESGIETAEATEITPQAQASSDSEDQAPSSSEEGASATGGVQPEDLPRSTDDAEIETTETDEGDGALVEAANLDRDAQPPTALPTSNGSDEGRDEPGETLTVDAHELSVVEDTDADSVGEQISLATEPALNDAPEPLQTGTEQPGENSPDGLRGKAATVPPPLPGRR